MSRETEETVLDRIMHYQAEECVSLDGVEDKESLRSELELIFQFFQKHELRPGDKNCSHVNYGGVARTWYSTVSGRYLFDTDVLPTLNKAIVRLAEVGVPLQLVECRDTRLDVFPLHFDIDVKLQDDEAGTMWNPAEIETEIVDEENGFRFFKIFAKILNLIYPKIGEMVVYSASGVSRGDTVGKVSFRIVFPNIVVDKERAPMIWRYITTRLTNLAREDTAVPYIRTLQKRLRQVSPANTYEKVVDESVFRCRNGVRMIFNDKIEKGKTTARIFKPLFSLVPEIGADDKISAMVVERKPTTSTVPDDITADNLEWLRLGSLVTPSLSHAVMTEWTRPNVRNTSRVTKTGPGGSSLALTNMTAADAARAATRATGGVMRRRAGFQNQASKEDGQPVLASFVWPSGTVSEFRRRMPVGVDAQFEQSQDGTITWRIAKRRNNWISFNETSKCIEASAPSNDTLNQLSRIILKIPTAKATAQTAPVVDTHAVEPRVEKKYRVNQNFEAEGDGELDVNVGDIVVIVTDDGSGWTAVRRLCDGREGFVPGVYIEEVVQCDDLLQL